MQYYIEVVDEKGHRKNIPFWKIPALVEASVKAQKSVFAAEAEEQKRRDEIQAQLVAARENAKLAEVQGVNAPFDISAPVEF